MTIHSRLAPTPSGYLHTGNAFNFILTWLKVRKNDGVLRLRIDDLDAPRVRIEYLQDIFYSLHWLGLDWDEGPQNVAEQEATFSQQERIPVYQSFIDKLIRTGKVFACTCSRSDILKASADGQYQGTCISKNIPSDSEGASLRIQTPEECIIDFEDERLGSVSIDLFKTNRHFIIARRDGIPAYHVASLCDDRDNQINCIVRGEDLLESTAAQLYLASLTDTDSFLQTSFCHHSLLQNESGEKLSKSAGSWSLLQRRKNGETKTDLLSDFCRWMNWDAAPSDLNDLLTFYRSNQSDG